MKNSREIEHDNSREANIARRGGVPKRSSAPAPIHSGMTRQQRDMAGVGGMGHGVSAPDASSANPLAPEPPGKRLE